MRKHSYALFFLLFFSFVVQAQRASYFRRVFVDAEYFLLYEDFRDALPLYIELFEAFPDNANVAYRIGLCYINILNEKHKSAPFFEMATKAITRSYKEGYFTETQAPREAFLYYGRALRIINEFSKSKQAFLKYLDFLDEGEEFERTLVAKELVALELAQEFIENPIPVKFTSAGKTINTRFPEINPVVSADSTKLLYTSVQQFYNAIMFSNRRARIWSHPFNVNSQIFADGQITTVGLSADGFTVLLSRNDNDVFNLYTSNYDPVKDQWGTINRLPKEINTRNWETYASFSPSGDTLYFSSNRPGGVGGFDIYYSVRTISGWTEAVNLGDIINTPFDEIAPTVSHDGNRLFFSSTGHPTMGGYDIFVSVKQKGMWGKPINLRHPINTTDDDVFYYPLGNGSSGYVSRILPESYGENDIYLLEYNLDSLIKTNTSIRRANYYPELIERFPPNRSYNRNLEMNTKP
jgi:tetratricopeptide (TPR) repeat protein